MKKLLIVVDMQKDFVDGSLGSNEAMSVVDNVVKEIEGFQGDIIVTMDTHYPDYERTLEGKYLPVVHCIKDTSGWMLDEKVRTALDKKRCETLEKVTFGSVYLPKLVAEKYQPCEIELIGLCTDICVISNALLLRAFFPNTEISVKADCCAGVTPEKHEAALEVMRSCQINII